MDVKEFAFVPNIKPENPNGKIYDSSMQAPAWKLQGLAELCGPGSRKPTILSKIDSDLSTVTAPFRQSSYDQLRLRSKDQYY